MAIVLLALYFVIKKVLNLAFSSNNHAETLFKMFYRFKKKNVTLNLSLISNYNIKGLNTNPQCGNRFILNEEKFHRYLIQ